MPTVSGFATTNAVVTTGWTNPTDAYTDNGVYATATIAAKNTIVSSRFGGFGVAGSIPGGATINSVTVECQYKVSTTASIARLGVQAQSPSGTNRGTQTLDTSEPLTDAVVTQVVPFATFGWTAADLADGTLFAVVEANQGNNATSCTYSLDYVQVTVDYSTTAAASTLTDNFEDNSFDTALWLSQNGTPTETGGRLVMAAATADAVHSQGNFNWQGSNGFIQVAAVPTGTPSCWFVARDATNYIAFHLSGTSLGFESSVVTPSPTSVTYDPVAHRYWRHREAGGTWFFDTSPDGGTWTNRSSATTPAFATSAFWRFLCDGGTGTYELEAVNLATTKAAAEAATGTGSALDATVSTVSGGTNALAEVATGTGVAYDATTDAPAPTVAGATPSVLGAQIPGASPIAAVPTAAVIPGQANAGAATGSGAAPDPSVAITAAANQATGTGAAPDPTPAVGGNADQATGTGTAPNASVAVTANAGVATGIGGTGLVETFEAFTNGETWADTTTHGQWFVQFGGNIGPGVGIETDGSLVLYEKPTAPTDPTPGAETHASLVTSTQTFGDIDYRVRAKTVQQLRQNLAPNAWEVAWLVWHYTDNAHFYYVALKPNGVELGKRHPDYAGGQRFLDTPATPTLTIGAWNEFRVTQTTNVITVFIDGTQVSTFTDTGGIQGDAAYTSGKVGLYNEDAWVRFDNVSVNQSIPAIGVNAGSATGTGSALDATVSTVTAGTAPAEVATGTGQALDATVAVTVNADQATGTGAAGDAVGAFAAAAGIASGTGAALDGQAAITVNADQATGTGSALDATVSTLALTNAPAEVASGVGSALDAQASAGANAGLASGTGTALDATVSTLALTNAPAEVATGSGVALDPSVAVAANAEAATGTGTAAAPTVATGVEAAAGLATGSGAAADPTPAITVNAGAATGTGQALDPIGQASRDAPAGLAAGTGSALDAAIAIVAAAEAAFGVGVAYDATAYIPPPVPPPRWVEGDSTATGIVEGALVGAGIIEGSSSL